MGAEACGRTVGFRIVVILQHPLMGTPSEKLKMYMMLILINFILVPLTGAFVQYPKLSISRKHASFHSFLAYFRLFIF